MNLATKFDSIHSVVKSNKWFRYFAVFNRIALAAGFIPSGLTKIFDERFTSLSVNHPMGNYLEALYHTGYYYPFIGYVQVTAAILLLIPRTATLGAILYFPIILNICILSLAVGFDGSLVTSPLMVLANLYLLCWDYDKLKYIFPFKQVKSEVDQTKRTSIDNKFPVKFFIGVFITVVLTVLIVTNSYDKKTRNTLQDCYSVRSVLPALVRPSNLLYAFSWLVTV
jgi:uncharacterized membrane protein YphA (DoxX/SURF4 family)